MSSDQQPQRSKGSSNPTTRPTPAKKRRKSLFLFSLICLMAGIYTLQMTGMDGAVPTIIGTVGYWFDKNWETPVRASMGTAMFVLFYGSALIGSYLAKQEEA